ncbi:hypothetical protein [Sphingomonas faeni]|uniref:hypothetical protein n=1 Tax=Sphingomonas faeni TaxID=185950 RepID=UPI003356FEC5
MPDMFEEQDIALGFDSDFGIDEGSEEWVEREMAEAGMIRTPIEGELIPHPFQPLLRASSRVQP